MWPFRRDRPEQVRQYGKGNARNYNARGSIYIEEVLQAPRAAEVPPAPIAGVQLQAERFFEIYRIHGIAVGNIPAFLLSVEGPKLTHKDVSSSENLIERLDDQLLEFTWRMFEVRPGWLTDGNPQDDQVKPTHDLDRSYGRFASFLLAESLRRERHQIWNWGGAYRPMANLTMLTHAVPAYATLEVDADSLPAQGMSAIYSVGFARFRNETIYRHRVVEVMRWDYWRTHYEVVGWMAMADACDVNVTGRLMNKEDVYAFSNHGRGHPQNVLQNQPQWSPSYPFMTSSAFGGEEAYLSRWQHYLTQFSAWNLYEGVDNAKQELREAIETARKVRWGEISEDDL